MNLPPGVTCDSCYAFRFCVGIGCTKPGATRCDYFPNRYHTRMIRGSKGTLKTYAEPNAPGQTF